MKKHEDFEGMVISLIPALKFAIRTWFCNCPQYLYLFGIDVECTPSVHDPGKKDVCFPKSTSLLNTFHIGSKFCFFPANSMSSTYTDENILFHDEQRDIHNLEFSPIHVSMGFSQIAFPTTVLPKDDRADSTQEERLDLQCWTMILAICVMEDESKFLETPIWEFSTIVSIFHIHLGTS